MKLTLVAFDAYFELDWSRYAIQVNDAFTEKDARSEYFDRLDKLIEVLERSGSHNAFGEGDFATGDDWYGPHRSLSFQLTSDRLLTPKLLSIVQSVIRSFPIPYMVSISYDSFLQGSRHGLTAYDFNAAVEADSVTLAVRKERVLSLLGLGDLTITL